MDGNIPRAVVPYRVCENPQEAMIIETDLETIYGPEKIHLKLATRPSNTVSGLLKLGSYEKPFEIADLKTHDFQRDALCLAMQQGKKAWSEASIGYWQQLQQMLQVALPSCKIEKHPEKKGYWCHLPEMKLSQVNSRFKKLQKKLVRSWKRHPYLLARRIAISKKLARSLRASEPEKEFLRFCNVVKHSVPEELPLALRSSRWFDATCLSQSAHREKAILNGLHEAEKEIHFLMQEIRSGSRLGVISIRIPHDQSPSRDYWVSLKPLTPSEGPSSKPLAAQQKRAGLNWHPLYETTRSASIAARLQVLAPPSKPNLEMSIYADNYVRNSIASETEFAISNGRSKVLRLPSGSYEYTVRSYTSSEVFYPRASDRKSKGIVAWKKRRPRLTIREW